MPAGTYQISCDSIIIRTVDVQFDLIHRRGAEDTVLASWQQHFDPLPGNVYEAQPYGIDQPAPAIAFEPGDQLVFRFTGMNATAMQAFIPNGDGELAGGTIPNLTLPQ